MTHSLDLLGSRILIGAGLLDGCGNEVRAAVGQRRAIIISDDTVAPLYAARLAAAIGSEPVLLTIPAGEASKTRMQWARLTDELLAANVGRDAVILALGGGVVGDLAGFVAATYMRGIPFVQIPTTLLAMVDASVGGKTGVDTRAGKNLVGAFHQPTAVVIDPQVLTSLPRPHLRSGLAEVIKHGVVASTDELAWTASHIGAVVRDGGPDAEIAAELVLRNVTVKAGIVERDERESGVRKTLNFGHTIGHAIESLSGYTRLHGECVALGMIVESRIASRIGVGNSEITDTLIELLQRAGLPVALPAEFAAAEILAATRLDKKARDGVVEYSLPARVGFMAGADTSYGIPVAADVVLAALADSRP